MAIIMAMTNTANMVSMATVDMADMDTMDIMVPTETMETRTPVAKFMLRSKSFIFILLGLAMSICSQAQRIGTWQLYPSFSDATQCQVTTDKVYGLYGSGNLLCYDKKERSVRTFDSLNDLNDIQILKILWSQKVRKLLIVYKN